MDQTTASGEIGAIGEFELIARLTADLPADPSVVIGVGDDAAVLACPPDMELVATCDAQVEGRHFLRASATAEQVGRKALAVNLSDIAAMGALPRAALISLALPSDTPLAWLDDLYAGLRAEAAAFGVAIVGGNVTATTGPLMIDVTLLGHVARGRAVTRAGGRAGDRLYVTGTLGAAAAGLITLRAPVPNDPVVAPTLLDRARAALLTPTPRVGEGMALAATGAVTAMLDVSDGLAADLGHLCERGGVGALVDATALPIDEAARAIAAAYGRDPLTLALSGGEDYALLFTARADAEPVVVAAVSAAGGTPHAIGWLTPPAEGMRLRHADGVVAPLPARGWDHLASIALAEGANDHAR